MMERDAQISRIAYNEAIRTIAEQERSLESIRGRATTNIAIVTLATSLLGPEVISAVQILPYGLPVLGLVGLLLVLSVTLSVLVLRSGYGWVFNQSAETILDNYLSKDSNLSVAEVYASLAKFLEGSINENEEKLRPLLKRMNGAFSVTVIQVLLTVIVITLSTWSPTMSQPHPVQQPAKPAPQQAPAPQPKPPVDPGRKIDRSDNTPLKEK
tara:strand:- start:541 stop:1176 length:636 start_codon:yes stop_codon:yes gene_type:complete